MVKFTILLKRKTSLSHDEFVSYHKTNHAPLFMSIPVVQQTVRRYVQEHAMPVDLPGLPPLKYDGITELWFDHVEAIGRCFGDDEYLARIRPDEAKFLELEGCDFIVSAENVVFA